MSTLSIRAERPDLRLVARNRPGSRDRACPYFRRNPLANRSRVADERDETKGPVACATGPRREKHHQASRYRAARKARHPLTKPYRSRIREFIRGVKLLPVRDVEYADRSGPRHVMCATP